MSFLLMNLIIRLRYYRNIWRKLNGFRNRLNAWGSYSRGDADYCNECNMLKQHLHR